MQEKIVKILITTLFFNIFATDLPLLYSKSRGERKVLLKILAKSGETFQALLIEDVSTPSENSSHLERKVMFPHRVQSFLLHAQ
jgi:hypothetical protein